MAYPIDPRYGLALKFAEFSLLPELLALVPNSPRPRCSRILA